MLHDHLWLLAWEQTMYLFIFILCKIPSRQLVEHTIKPHYRFWPLLSNTKNNTLFSQASLWKQSIANTLFPQASLRKQSIRQLTPLNDNLKKYIKPKNALLFTRRLPFSFRCSPPLAQVLMCLRLAQVSMCLWTALAFYCQAYMPDFIFHKMTTPWCWFHRLVFLGLVDWQNERNYVFLCHTLGAAPPLDPYRSNQF